MSDLSSLNPADPGPTTDRRDRLAARARRAGCGILHINNSMQELLALASIGKAIRDARTEVQGQQNLADTEAASSSSSRQASAETPPAAGNSLLESMLQTSGQVVCKKS